MESFESTISIGSLIICQSLKLLSKVSARCHSQEYLLGKFLANCYESVCGRVYFQSNYRLSAYCSEYLWTDVY